MAKDHARERKKPFCAKNKVNMFANFEVGRLIKRRRRRRRRRWQNRQFSNFLYVIVAVYFTYFESFTVYKTLVGHVMCLKGLITVPFESSEQIHLLRLFDVSVPSLLKESTNSMKMTFNFFVKACMWHIYLMSP